MKHLIEQLENLILIHEQSFRQKREAHGAKMRAKQKQRFEVKMGRACGPGKKMVFGRCQKVKRLRGR